MQTSLFWIALAAIAGALAFIRLAPSDPARWHVPSEISENKDFDAGVERIVKADPDGLARLHEVILATPRTRVLAGSPQDAMVTYITRSAVFGFPDYTTVQLDGDSLKIHARLRFGLSDTGVNRDRVQRWIKTWGGGALQP